MVKKYYYQNRTIDLGKDYKYSISITSGGTPYIQNELGQLQKCDHVHLRVGVAIAAPNNTEILCKTDGTFKVFK
jgi:hypothetical protein